MHNLQIAGGPVQGTPAAGSPPLPTNKILIGDVLDRLKEIPSVSIDCIVTSPPYFGVRNYGHHRQLGAEGSISEWVDNLRAVCRQAARVLKPTGALWLNLGDSYSRHEREGAPHKSLLLGPTRLALALIRDGWTLRNNVIWSKTNPLPSSVQDRLTPTYETVFFLVRSRRYYFNLDAIREALTTTAKPSASNRPRLYPPDETRRTSRGVNRNDGLGALKQRGRAGHPRGKNPGDVWRLATAHFRGQHFAVFPEALAERPILATCPEEVCVQCGRPWQAVQTSAASHIGGLKAGCACRAGSQPGIVLDPFMGAGTTALVAEKHRRRWLGIELNPTFAALAEERLAAWRKRRAGGQEAPSCR